MKLGPERDLEEVEIDIVEVLLEIGGAVSERVELDPVALALQVPAIMHGADIERAPALAADRLLVEREVDAVQRDALRAGTGIGVALPADRREDRGGEGGRVGGKRELLKIEADLRGDRRRHARIGKRLLEISARHVIGAELVIEDAELELEARRVRRVDQHAFERGDGALIVADLRGERRVFEGEVEIVRPGKHLLEQSFASRFDIGRPEPLHGDGRIAGNSGRGPAHGETGNRDGDRPLGPPQHHVTARPFREGACRLIPAQFTPSHGKPSPVNL